MTSITQFQGVQGFVDAFANLDSRLGNEPSWWKERRAKALEFFKTNGFPTPRQEEWKYTSLKSVEASSYVLPGNAEDLDAAAVKDHFFDTAGPQLVFVNGQYRADLSRSSSESDGLSIQPLAVALQDASFQSHVESYWGENGSWQDHPFVALNQALLQDGTVIRVKKNASQSEPIHLIHVTDNRSQAVAAHSKLWILVEEGASVDVVESHATTGQEASLTNTVTEVAVAANAKVQHVRIQAEGETTSFFSNLAVRVERDGRFATHTASYGSHLSRHEIYALLDDPGVECTLNGVYLIAGDQQIDNRTMIDHAKPHGESHENYKGVLSGLAKGAFNGKILVRPDAQKTDAKQSSQGLLLSEGSEINSKPELEIYADDVKCTHGATTGAIDQDALFYLRARGVPEAQARRMLVHAFLGDIVNHIPHASARDRIENAFTERLSG